MGGSNSSAANGEDRGACRQCGYGFSSRGDEAGAGVFSGPNGLAIVKNIIRGNVSKSELERIWEAYDANADGIMSTVELRQLLKDLIAAVQKILVHYNSAEEKANHLPPDVVVARYRAHLNDSLNADSKNLDGLVDEWRKEFDGDKNGKIERDEFTSKGGGGFYSALKKYLDTVELTKGTPRPSEKPEPGSPAGKAAAAAAANAEKKNGTAPAAATAAPAPAAKVESARAPTSNGGAASAAPTPMVVETTSASAPAPSGKPARAFSIGDAGRAGAASVSYGDSTDLHAIRQTSPSLTGWESDRSTANSVDAGSKSNTESAKPDRAATNVSVADPTRGLSPSVAFPMMAQQLLENQEKAVQSAKA